MGAAAALVVVVVVKSLKSVVATLLESSCSDIRTKLGGVVGSEPLSVVGLARQRNRGPVSRKGLVGEGVSE